MNRYSTFTIAVAAIIGSTLLFAAYVLRSMFIPTRGKRIGSYLLPNKALLVLDIQESGGNRQNISSALPIDTPFGQMLINVNRLIECFERSGHEVAYVRQVFTSNIITRLHGGRILAGRMEPRICRWVNVINKNDFAKNRTDAFSNKQLEQFLIDHQVEEIFLVGLDAAFCVYYTALGALNRGYRVTVVTDAILTGRNMRQILQRYHEKGISVLSSQEAIMEVTKKP